MLLRTLLGVIFITLAAVPVFGSVVKIVGQQHTLALMSDGRVVGWGVCDSGQLGPVAAIPQVNRNAIALVEVKLPRKAVDIAVAGTTSFALLDDGTVYGWGSNRDLLLGIEVSTKLATGQPASEVPVKIPGLSDIVAIAWNLALKRDGTVYIWGAGSKSISGDGKSATRILGLTSIKQLSVGDTHSMALDRLGNVWTWGGSVYGALGRLTDDDKPKQVDGISDVIAVAAGLGVSTAVKRDGTVWVWGSNWQGQFGNGLTTPQPIHGGLKNQIQLAPVQVAGIANAVAVTSGLAGRHTIVLLKDGSLRGWGNSDWGQLGGGVSGQHQPRVMTPRLTGVKTVFAVHNNTYAIKTDGSVWIWGASFTGGFPLKAQARLPARFQGI